MKNLKPMFSGFAILLIAGCAEFPAGADKTRDRGVDGKHLSELQAGIWVDPNGCDHWIVDDGVEGYMSPRLARDGTPVCSGVAQPNTATGRFKEGSAFSGAL